MHAPKLDRLVIYGIYSISFSTITTKIHNTFSICLDSVEKHFLAVLTFFCESYVLFMRPASTFFRKITSKLGLTALFTHLKIILLQYF